MKFLLIFSLTLLISGLSFGQSNVKKKVKLTENEKIEKLISDLSNIEGGIFIYNNHRVPIIEAGNYFHNKRQNLAKTFPVKTAEEFIVQIASTSTNTGHLYEFENKDGEKAYIGDYLMKKLEEIEEK
jgi:hypothetical protein